jgi:long-subunit acyl-CoA synthetase (AMP-forming)
MDHIEEEKLKPLQEKIPSAQLLSFASIEMLGKEKKKNPEEVNPEDICAICYTSGSTGRPKVTPLLLSPSCFLLLLVSFLCLDSLTL